MARVRLLGRQHCIPEGTGIQCPPDAGPQCALVVINAAMDLADSSGVDSWACLPLKFSLDLEEQLVKVTSKLADSPELADTLIHMVVSMRRVVCDTTSISISITHRIARFVVNPLSYKLFWVKITIRTSKRTSRSYIKNGVISA
jgi:hypothetical protein